VISFLLVARFLVLLLLIAAAGLVVWTAAAEAD
jgi:hypothetical protein